MQNQPKTEDDDAKAAALADVPLRLCRFVKRLATEKDADSILFIVRIGDNLHRAFYGTFLTQSLTAKLSQHLKLGNGDLELTIHMSSTTWNVRQGKLVVTHQIASDYDMQTVTELTKISGAVLENKLTPTQGLQRIRQYELSQQQQEECCAESRYRDFPGRALVLPLMSAACAAVFFGGTWVDFCFAGASGVAGGFVAYWADRYKDKSITGISDYLAAMFTALIGMGSVAAFPDAVCFSAQVLGTLFWFFYGTAFVIGVYEMCNNQVMTGMTRYAAAIVQTYGLAVGVMLGVWFSPYLGDQRFMSLQDDCSTKTNQISDLWYILLFPLSAVACLMQFRVALADFGIGLIVQTIAYGTQYAIGALWKQPVLWGKPFVANLVPTFFAVLTSQLCIYCLQWRKLANLAYQGKKADKDDDGQTRSRTESSCSLELYDGDYEEGHNSNEFDWTEQDNCKGRTVGGYLEDDLLTYKRSDIWSPLLPALYLLVPGSKLLQTTFTEMLGELDVKTPDGSTPSHIAGLASSLFVIALGQVVGLRLGFAALSAARVVTEFFCERQRPRSSDGSTKSTQPSSQQPWTLDVRRTPNGDSSNAPHIVKIESYFSTKNRLTL